MTVTVERQRPLIGDIFFGKTDAKHELISAEQSDVSRFMDSFIIPKNIRLDDYFEGKKFLLTGLKGTGKTALLRYLDNKVKDEFRAESTFILFKSDFDESDRQSFHKTSNISIVDNETNFSSFNNKKTVWMWLLHRSIIDLAEKSFYPIFKKDKNWNRYITLINSVVEEEKPTSFIRKLFPSAKKGLLELNADFKIAAAKLGIELEWENAHEYKIKFEQIINQANQYFSELIPDNGRIYILLDELELSLMNSKQYKRDLELIKDLILALNHINSISRQKKFQVYFIASIRLEVMTAIETTGEELNKIVEDFGTEIHWHYTQADSYDNPLIQIIIKRLISNEKALGIYKVRSDKEIFDDYFDYNIGSIDTKKYILERTWYRPRDIVRLLTLAQESNSRHRRFNKTVFNSTKKQYSIKSWTESIEELRARYTTDEITGIKQIFQGISSPLSLTELKGRVDGLKELYPEINKLLNKKMIGPILNDCFKIGIIGNGNERVRFAFRGDDSLDLMQPIQIHRALWEYLAVTQNTRYNKANQSSRAKRQRKK